MDKAGDWILSASLRKFKIKDIPRFVIYVDWNNSKNILNQEIEVGSGGKKLKIWKCGLMAKSLFFYIEIRRNFEKEAEVHDTENVPIIVPKTKSVL